MLLLEAASHVPSTCKWHPINVRGSTASCCWEGLRISSVAWTHTYCRRLSTEQLCITLPFAHRRLTS